MWDYESDVVVIGYSGAGSAAAITAHDAGAQVLRVALGVTPGRRSWIPGGDLSPVSITRESWVRFITASIPVEETSAKRSRSVELLARTPPWSCHCRGNELATT